MKKPKHKLLRLVASVMMAMALILPISKVHAEQTGSITITKWPVDGTEFSIYKIAGLNGTDYVPDEAYKEVIEGKDLNHMPSADLENVAEELDKVIKSKEMKPEGTLAYKVSGTNTFSNLTAGLYLVEENTVKVDKTTYSSQKSLIRIPDGDINYNVTSELKVSKKTESTPVPTPTPTASVSPEPSNNVQTGDRFKGAYYAGIIAIDAGIVILYFALRRKAKKQGNE